MFFATVPRPENKRLSTKARVSCPYHMYLSILTKEAEYYCGRTTTGPDIGEGEADAPHGMSQKVEDLKRDVKRRRENKTRPPNPTHRKEQRSAPPKDVVTRNRIAGRQAIWTIYRFYPIDHTAAACVLFSRSLTALRFFYTNDTRLTTATTPESWRFFQCDYDEALGIGGGGMMKTNAHNYRLTVIAHKPVENKSIPMHPEFGHVSSCFVDRSQPLLSSEWFKSSDYLLLRWLLAGSFRDSGRLGDDDKLTYTRKSISTDSLGRAPDTEPIAAAAVKRLSVLNDAIPNGQPRLRSFHAPHISLTLPWLQHLMWYQKIEMFALETKKLLVDVPPEKQLE
ncbi:hypothetical protein ACRALDRAFT_212250 [Sodiomyces alcalophilus JCM 7366]|uniref:uncharacterized protein n=1 Tax=Sodiomyces alcalophilus JCM 7366 TaxID=591952 RepID=UPI0039B40744